MDTAAAPLAETGRNHGRSAPELIRIKAIMVSDHTVVGENVAPCKTKVDVLQVSCL